MKINPLYVAILAILSSCATQRRYEDDVSALKTSYTGYNNYGELRTCYAMPVSKVCTSPVTAREKIQVFKEWCLKKELKLFRCDCESYLCAKPMDKEFEGQTPN